ncbi:Acyl-protein thioesterase 2 [Gracilaria domingensis]|nr:Acyl-protein thioesterase 2 [Gracilaria domingensis]
MLRDKAFDGIDHAHVEHDVRLARKGGKVDVVAECIQSLRQVLRVLVRHGGVLRSLRCETSKQEKKKRGPENTYVHEKHGAISSGGGHGGRVLLYEGDPCGDANGARQRLLAPQKGVQGERAALAEAEEEDAARVDAQPHLAVHNVRNPAHGRVELRAVNVHHVQQLARRQRRQVGGGGLAEGADVVPAAEAAVQVGHARLGRGGDDKLDVVEREEGQRQAEKAPGLARGAHAVQHDDGGRLLVAQHGLDGEAGAAVAVALRRLARRRQRQKRRRRGAPGARGGRHAAGEQRAQKQPEDGAHRGGAWLLRGARRLGGGAGGKRARAATRAGRPLGV